MRQINVANEKGRDAQVGFGGAIPKATVRQVLPDGRAHHSVRVLKATPGTAENALAAKCGGMDHVAEALIQGDPEVDLETVGACLTDVSKLYLDPDGNVVYNIQFIEVLHSPDGAEKERRPLKTAPSNIATERPIRWTGKLLPKEKAVKMFVFSRKYQLQHVNGLTFDFLYEMAKKLHEAKALLLVGGGEKGNEPLVFSNGGVAYRGFLEGRVSGERYCLLLHLSNLELKEITQ